MLYTVKKSIDPCFTIATTSTSVTSAIMRFGLVVRPISIAVAFGLSVNCKDVFQVTLIKYIYFDKSILDISTNFKLV